MQQGSSSQEHDDAGGLYAVVPLPTCPHLEQTADVPEAGIDAKSVCETCQCAAEPWVCLTCYKFPAQFPPYPCIVLAAQIDLYLTYTDSTGKEVDTVVHVLPTSPVDEDQSSCSRNLYVQNQPVLSQILHINLNHYPGWNVRLAFTKDRRVNAVNQFVLYQINVTADYPATKTLFENAPDTIYYYTQPVDLKNPPTIADTIFGHLNTSLSCTSEQKFWINKDPKQGPLASYVLLLGFMSDNPVIRFKSIRLI
ncbi:hypothetical protein Aduo_012566 [Ancylostoma duodenale]